MQAEGADERTDDVPADARARVRAGVRGDAAVGQRSSRPTGRQGSGLRRCTRTGRRPASRAIGGKRDTTMGGRSSTALRSSASCSTLADIDADQPAFQSVLANLSQLPNVAIRTARTPTFRLAGNARAAEPAVAVGILREVLLVVLLCVVERRRRADLGRDGAEARSLASACWKASREDSCDAAAARRRCTRRSLNDIACRCRCPAACPAWDRATSQNTFSSASRLTTPGSYTTSTASVWPVCPEQTSR